MSGRVMERQIVVRMSEELHQALRDDAEANGRTVAQSFRFHVRRSLAVIPSCSTCKENQSR